MKNIPPKTQNNQIPIFVGLALLIGVIILAGYLVLTGQKNQAPSAGSTPTPSATPAPSITLAPSVTPLPSPTRTATPTSVSVSPKATSTATPSSPASISPANNKVAQFKVSGNEFFFNPNTITVQAGQKVTILFQNDGQVPHNWALPSLGITTATVAPGQSDTISFIAPNQSGEARIECTVPGHAERGMVGTLVVK